MLLKVRGLSKNFGGLAALSNVDLEIQRGMVFSLIGPNGAGKTTFFNCVTGFQQAARGTVTFKGKNIGGRKPNQISRSGIARTFQNIRLFAEMTALENVMVGAHTRLKSGLMGALFRPRWVSEEERALASHGLRLLEFVGLNHRADEWARNLSYGEQRRLEIARALAGGPELLLLDEPAAGMNPNETLSLMNLIRRILDRDVTVLLIEHDMKVVMGISDRICVLDHGEKIAEGTPGDIQQNARVIEAYLGKTGKPLRPSSGPHGD